MGEGEFKKVLWRGKKLSLRRRMWRKLKICCKGRGRASKGICCCDRIVVIWEFSFVLLTNKTERALVYRPGALCLHLQLAVHTVQMNLIRRQGRYLMGNTRW